MLAFIKKLEAKGVTVYRPFLTEFGSRWDTIAKQDQYFVALGLTLQHFKNIEMVDVTFIFNKDAYVGVSTTLEIGYACAKNKPIYVLEDGDSELKRSILYRGITSTPESLIKILA